MLNYKGYYIWYNTLQGWTVGSKAYKTLGGAKRAITYWVNH